MAKYAGTVIALLHSRDGQIENTFSREILGKEAFRLLDLPVEVDAGKMEATFGD